MSNIVIKSENLSKAYQLGEIGTGTISRDLERWIAKLRGKEDPFLRVGETNDRTNKGTSDIIWSLKDINFEIEQGDAVGIIGRNGAGKSTLLKILSKVTAPTSGKITGKGRIASLLEVGTGFHPELTGRENIYLNGAILGMRKREISRKFDEIVCFAGVERYIDTPVKRYSSGMYVRLAFAVAAHLESEILIVDEVLAVGDAEFQKKCLGKMGAVSKGEGRTVLFVSHNMGAVKELCSKSILLEHGQLVSFDTSNTVISKYLSNNLSRASYDYKINSQRIGDESVILLSLRVVDEKFTERNDFFISERVGIEAAYQIVSNDCRPEPTIALKNDQDVVVLHNVTDFRDYGVGNHQVIFWIPEHFLNNIEYTVILGITTNSPFKIHLQQEISFSVLDDLTSPSRGQYTGKLHGVVRPHLKSEKKRA